MRPALLDLGSDDHSMGITGGVIEGLTDDHMHLGPLGRVMSVQQCVPLFIVDSWPNPEDGVVAVRLFELRIADIPSFYDGIV